MRNENYWNSDAEGNQLPYLDSIAFRPIPDEGTRLDAVLSGTVDAMQSLRQGTIRDARADGSRPIEEHIISKGTPSRDVIIDFAVPHTKTPPR